MCLFYGKSHSPIHVLKTRSTYTCNIYTKSRLDVISTLTNPQANYTPWDFSSRHIPPSLPTLTDRSPLMNQPSKLYNSRRRFLFFTFYNTLFFTTIAKWMKFYPNSALFEN